MKRRIDHKERFENEHNEKNAYKKFEGSFGEVIQVSFSNNEFTCKCAFEERTIPREAGFFFDSLRKLWVTPKPSHAARLRPYLDESAKIQINRIFLSYEDWSRRIPYPDHLEPYPYQLESARFALSRNRSYLGLDPGLGKTIVAALIMNALPTEKFIYVCPPFLVSDVQYKLERWAPKGWYHILKDTKLEGIDTLIGAGAKNLIVDEAHRFKNETAKRSKALFDLAEKFQRVVFMSGTPMPNRPIELYSVLNFAAPENIGFMSRFQYAKRYCDAQHNGFGWDYSGASNLKELKSKVQIDWRDYEKEKTAKKFMLRIRKDVIDLPPKLEEVVLIADNLPPKIGKLDRELVSRFAGSDFKKAEIAAELSRNELHLATYRRELGRSKLDAAMPFILSILDETEENLILAAWHREVATRLSSELTQSNYSHVLIDGSVDPKKRPELARHYQEDKKTRVAILNIIAGGLGLDLQKTDRVIFVEYSWVPGENQQLLDRAHRIGRKGSVLGQYLVFKNSIDRAVIESMLAKRRSTETL